jgi:hypothetical protein
MDANSIQIRFGELQDVIGAARHQGDLAVVPATIRFTGYSMTNGSFLDEFLATREISTEITALIRPGKDAPWACGRIQRVFALAQIPEEDRAEKSCMGFSFLAAFPQDDLLIGIPFECTDYYGRSVLLFNGEAPPQELIDRVANGFWSMLLEEPHDLPEYTDRFAHLGGGFDVAFGVRDGEPFLEEIV